MAKVLITGGAGFIGSHVVETFLAANHEVTVVDDLSLGQRDWVHPRARFVHGTILDLPLMRELSKGQDGVIHLAAMSRVAPSIGTGAAGTLSSAEPNIMGTLNCLIAASEAGVKRFVYSASSTAYGNIDPPHNEYGPVSPETPYALSKYIGELYCHQFERQFDLATVCLRYFQVYGPRCPSRGSYAMVSSIFIEQVLRGEPITVHGLGDQRRDFVHVSDVAYANLLAFGGTMRDTAINVGTGVSHSILELAQIVAENTQRVGPAETLPPPVAQIVHTAPRALDMKETLADTDKCQRLFHWSPNINFRQGTINLIKHMTANARAE